MKQSFQVNIQRVDNGFVAIAQNDEPGIKTKKIVAHTEDEVKKAVQDFIDHMFDPAPSKPEPVKPTQPVPTEPTPVKE